MIIQKYESSRRARRIAPGQAAGRAGAGGSLGRAAGRAGARRPLPDILQRPGQGLAGIGDVVLEQRVVAHQKEVLVSP